MANHKGVVEIQTTAGDPTVVFDGEQGHVTVGGSGQDGQITVATGSGIPTLEIDGSTGTVRVLASDGEPIVDVDGATGTIAVYRKVAGVNTEILTFDASSAELRVGNEGVEGDLVVRDGGGRETLRFDAGTAALYIGAQGNEGDLLVRDAAGHYVLHFNASDAGLYVGGTGNEGDVIVRDDANRQRVKLDGGAGDIWVRSAAGHPLFYFDSTYAALWLGGQGNEGDLIVRDGANRDRIKLDGGDGDIWVRDAAGNPLFYFDSTYAALWLGGHGNEGDLIVRDGANRERIKLDGGDGDIWVRDAAGNPLFYFDSTYAALYLGGPGNEGDLIVRNNAGNQTIKLDGDSGDIILSNGDAAEDFDVDDEAVVTEGMVMVLGDEGRLRPCATEYDQRVVGVVSGAGRYRPGIVMDRGATRRERRVPISIMGKVSCLADAASGSIRVGDMLTTSATPGCAMKASDPEQAFGSVIGKALSSLEEGEGLVSMLICLQ